MRATSPDHSVRSASPCRRTSQSDHGGWKFDLTAGHPCQPRADRRGNPYRELNATHKKLVTKRPSVLLDPVGGTWRGSSCQARTLAAPLATLGLVVLLTPQPAESAPAAWLGASILVIAGPRW